LRVPGLVLDSRHWLGKDFVAAVSICNPLSCCQNPEIPG
jgi:hypothetical protein